MMQSATVRTVAVRIEPVPLAQAMRQAETAQTMELAPEMERRRQGFMTNAADHRRAQAATGREEELSGGFAEMRSQGSLPSRRPRPRPWSGPQARLSTRANSPGWSSRGCTGST